MNYTFYYTPEFLRSVKKLNKKYHTLADDLTDFQQEFVSNPNIGVDLGSGYRKIRVSISGKGKGKKGGARIITFELYVKLVEDETGVLLVDLYDKNEITNMPEEVYTYIAKQYVERQNTNGINHDN